MKERRGCPNCAKVLALINQHLSGRVYDDLDDALRNLLQAFVTMRDLEKDKMTANQMLDNIRGSLRGYPNCGGDIVAMQEVERIAAKAKLEAFYFFKEREAYHNAFRNCSEDGRIEGFRADIDAERERLEKEAAK